VDAIGNGAIQIVLMCRLGGKGWWVADIGMEGGDGRGAAVPMRPMRGRVQRLGHRDRVKRRVGVAVMRECQEEGVPVRKV